MGRIFSLDIHNLLLRVMEILNVLVELVKLDRYLPKKLAL